MVMADSDFHRVGQKPFRQAEHSHNRVVNLKSFNLYFGKLLNTEVLGNVQAENMLLFLKKIFFANFWLNISRYYYIVIKLYCLRDF